jgi:hypothetical protein
MIGDFAPSKERQSMSRAAHLVMAFIFVAGFTFPSLASPGQASYKPSGTWIGAPGKQSNVVCGGVAVGSGIGKAILYTSLNQNESPILNIYDQVGSIVASVSTGTGPASNCIFYNMTFEPSTQQQ